jgi:hypothetical protein
MSRLVAVLEMARTAHLRPNDSRPRRQRPRAGASWAAVTLAATLATLFAPIAQAAEQKLTASDGAAADHFGRSVAVSGDTMVVGAPFQDVGGNFNRGSAYVFVRSSGVWTLQQKLIATDGAAGDNFGLSVAVAGDTIVVGALGDDIGANASQGSASVFVRNAGVWTLQQKLTASDGAAGDNLGWSVGISGDTAIVGATADDVGANANQGSAYAFVRSGGVWTQQQKLTASDGAVGDQLGFSVAISSDTVVAGALGDDAGANFEQGSAYVFVRSGGVWSDQQKLTASDGTAGDQLGSSVAIGGDTIAVGVRLDDVGANANQGSAYAFVRSGGAWTQQQKLTASDGGAGEELGFSVAIGGDTIAVGAPGDDVGANANQGSAYAFVRSGGVWSDQQKLTASDGGVADGFGWSVAIGGDTIAVGAVGDDIGANSDQGSVYVFADPVPASIALAPPSDTNVVGSTHTVTATVTDAGGNPLQDIIVRFSVSGSVTTSGTCTTGADGACSFSYTGPQLPGADSISAYADTDGDGLQDAGEPGAEATKAWVLPASTPGSVSGGGNIEVAGNRIAFGFSARSGDNGIEGSCNVIDQVADVMVRCQDVTSFVITGNTATVFGNATVNGVPTTYRIDAVDNADPGRGADTFSIQTASGYSRSGTLTGGNIQVG